MQKHREKNVEIFRDSEQHGVVIDTMMHCSSPQPNSMPTWPVVFVCPFTWGRQFDSRLCDLDLRLKRSRVRISAVPLWGNNIGQVVHTHVPLSPSSKFGTGQRAVMPCGWEGNRRSGVALAMRHRLQWFIHLWAHGPRKGDEQPAYSPRGVWHSFTLPLCEVVNM